MNLHDKNVYELFMQYELCQNRKKDIVACFLSSLSNSNLILRSVLPVYAIMETFPNHKFELIIGQHLSEISPCRICSEGYGYGYTLDDYDFYRKSLENSGGISTSIGYYIVALSEYNKIKEVIKPKNEDIGIFSKILTIILNANEDDTLKKNIQKEIGRIKEFKSNSLQRQRLLETLGYCSILETKEHKGLLNTYTNVANAPRKTHSSDWKYPVDFWLGKDGINKEALKFWFGEYKELEIYWK